MFGYDGFRVVGKDDAVSALLEGGFELQSRQSGRFAGNIVSYPGVYNIPEELSQPAP